MDEKFHNLTLHKYTRSVINLFHWHQWGCTKVISKSGPKFLFRAVSCHHHINPEWQEKSPILKTGFGRVVTSTCLVSQSVQIKMCTGASACKVKAASWNKNLTKGKSSSIWSQSAGLDLPFSFASLNFVNASALLCGFQIGKTEKVRSISGYSSLGLHGLLGEKKKKGVLHMFFRIRVDWELKLLQQRKRPWWFCPCQGLEGWSTLAGCR